MFIPHNVYDSFREEGGFRIAIAGIGELLRYFMGAAGRFDDFQNSCACAARPAALCAGALSGVFTRVCNYVRICAFDPVSTRR